MKVFRRLLAIVILFWFLVSFAGAQNWENGFLVLHSNDTLHGEIKVGKRSFYDFVWFRSVKDEHRLKYWAEELREVETASCKLIVKEIFNENMEKPFPTLAIPLERGEVNLYFAGYRKVTCSCNPEGTFTFGYILEKNNQVFCTISKPFMGIIRKKRELNKTLEDRGVNLQLDQIEKLKFDDIPELVKKFNEGITFWRE